MTTSRPTSPTRDVDAVADRLHSAAIHLLRRVRKEDDASGLTAPRLSALSVLVFGGPKTIGELAAAEQVRPPTMSVIVADLARAGLVTREPDPDDGRIDPEHDQDCHHADRAVVEFWRQHDEADRRRSVVHGRERLLDYRLGRQRFE